MIQQASLCNSMRDEAEPIWNKIFAHPFLQELEQGTLPDETLQFYFVQNYHYNKASTHFCAQALAKAPTDDSREWLIDVLSFARAELGRLREYVAELSNGAPVDWTIAPTCHHYTQHLLALAAYGETVDLLVGQLPCSWTYDLFAKRLMPLVHHPVADIWLAGSGGSEHNDLTEQYRDLIDDLSRDISPDREAELRKSFLTGSRYEWMFWEMAYTHETWPV